MKINRKSKNCGEIPKLKYACYWNTRWKIENRREELFI